MKTLFIITLFFEMLFYNLSAFSQQNCQNADFSFHDFTNWQGFTGTYGACCPTPGIVTGRHTIIDSVGTDPNTGNGLSILPAELNVCARIGNSSTGAEAERLSYSFTVDSTNTAFYFYYAVVLEDPSHSLIEQPKFDIVATASTTLGLCGEFHIISGAGIPGFQDYGGVRWKDWTINGINLLNNIGENFTIDFTTYDCAQSGHYGYAYISCGCMSKTIQATYSQDSLFITLTAPLGFNYLWNTGETTRVITINNPIEGTIYTCNLNSNLCAFMLSYTIAFPLKVEEFIINDLNIFPNPSTNSTIINIPNENINCNYLLEIYNYNNQLINRTHGNGNKIKLNTNEYSKGLYFISIITNSNKIYKTKLIVD